MPVIITWHEIAVRLLWTVVAGALIGINRGEHGRPAGLRTTMLVCLAASLSMIQVNLLLNLAGRRPDSFVIMDLMRLPLGILSGMGFIGAGAILRKNELVLGVTTAATLWFVTVMGLCFGGGQIALGATALVIGILVLWGLKWLEQEMPKECRATLLLMAAADGPTEEQLRARVHEAGYQILSAEVEYVNRRHRRSIRCQLSWRSRFGEDRAPELVNQLAQQPGVLKVQWKPAMGTIGGKW